MPPLQKIVDWALNDKLRTSPHQQPLPQPNLQPLPGQTKYKLLQDFSVTLFEGTDLEYTVTVRDGYETDGATIPRPLWSLVGSPFDPRFMAAALIHDHFCDQAIKRNSYDLRVVGDCVFFVLLHENGVRYLAVLRG